MRDTAARGRGSGVAAAKRKIKGPADPTSQLLPKIKPEML